MSKIPFKALGRDLFAEVKCSCKDPRWADNEVLRDTPYRIKFTGYADSYFFEVVNKEPRKLRCGNCGKAYLVQWFEDGVEVKELYDDKFSAHAANMHHELVKALEDALKIIAGKSGEVDWEWPRVGKIENVLAKAKENPE